MNSLTGKFFLRRGCRSLGECILPCSVCVATINVNGVKYVLVCTNGCKIDVAIAGWKKNTLHGTALQVNKENLLAGKSGLL